MDVCRSGGESCGLLRTYSEDIRVSHGGPQTRGQDWKHYVSGGSLLCREPLQGYTLLHIGVLGSRFPLDNLRRTLPLLWDEARSPAGSPYTGNPNG